MTLLLEGKGCATDDEMRSAVERWATARKIYGESIVSLDDGMRVLVTRGDLRDVSAHTALVWALVLEARPLRDGSKCKRCYGRGTWDVWNQWTDVPDTRLIPSLLQRALGADTKGWAMGRPFISPLSRFGWAIAACHRGPCPACDGTGLADLTDAAARHVLDAQPTHHGNPAVYTWTKPGNPASIEALHVLADRLQEWECTACLRPTPPRAGGCRYCGEPLRPNPLGPLGLHIGMLLAGRGEGTTDAVAQLEWRTSIRVSQRGEGDGSS